MFCASADRKAVGKPVAAHTAPERLELTKSFVEQAGRDMRLPHVQPGRRPEKNVTQPVPASCH